MICVLQSWCSPTTWWWFEFKSEICDRVIRRRLAVTMTATATVRAEDARVTWANAMRRCVTRPDAIHADGSIDQAFFKPKKVVFETANKKWGEEERGNLLRGIETYGLGEWGVMKRELLPDWDTLSLRVKASRMMGTQSLARYPKGWRGDAAAVEAEYAKNKAIGEATGCWKSGTLVEDDHGSVAKYIEANGL